MTPDRIRQLQFQVVARAEGMLGVRFRHRGRSSATGLDCSGLVVCSFATVALGLPDSKSYRMSPDPKDLRERLEARFVQVPAEDVPQPADVALMTLDTNPEPTHMAIHDGQGRVLHVMGRTGRVRRESLREIDCARPHSTWRLREWQL